jgi:hypothetical protein
VSDGKALLRPRKKDFRLRKPVISDLFDPLPRDPPFLAASRQRAAPEVDHVMAEGSDRCRVGRHGVIGKIASDNLRQPAPLLGDRLMHPLSHLLLDLLKLAPHAVTPGFPHEEELAVAGTSADVRETQEIEGLRFTEPALAAPVRRLAAEFDQAGLLRM